MDTLFNSVCGSSPGGCDTVGVWLGALLTILVFTYLIRDGMLFRLAQSLLVGTAIGYGSAVILRTVLWDGLLTPLLNDSATYWPLVVPFIAGLFLLTKLAPRWAGVLFGNISLGYLFGVGAALAIGGALNGALVPQLGATMLSVSPVIGLDNMLNNILLIVGTIGALLAFRFTSSLNSRPLRLYATLATSWGQVGRAFIMVAFGAIFANTLTARVSTLVGQLYFLFHDWLGVVK